MAREIPRGRVDLVAQTTIEHGAFPDPRFLVRREAILFSQAGRRIILMLVVPVMHHLLIVLVELWIIPSVWAIIPSPTILCEEKTSANAKHKRGKCDFEG